MEKPRLVFVDLLRGWALLVMIETHVFNAMIIPGSKETPWFDVLSFINGLVAPSFLFVSGFVFVVSSRRKIDDLRTFRGTFWKQVGRMVLIWIVAYGLHLQFFSFRRMLTETTAEGWLNFYQADVLHCIVVGWLFLLLSLIFVRSESVYRRWLLVSGLLAVFVTPFLWEIDFNRILPAPIAAYLNGQHHSFFPLFPWLGFMALGGLTASLYLEAQSKGNQKEFINRIALTGAVLVVLAVSFSLITIRLEYASTAWRANPLFFLLRFGIVLLLSAACWYYVERRHTERSFVLDVSRESLLVYVAHLLIIYGKYFGDKSLELIYGKTFNPLECFVATIGLAVLMILAGKTWGWLKRRSQAAARWLSFAVATVAVIMFFIRES